jgi:hypothetical protein
VLCLVWGKLCLRAVSRPCSMISHVARLTSSRLVHHKGHEVARGLQVVIEAIPNVTAQEAALGIETRSCLVGDRETGHEASKVQAASREGTTRWS